MRLACSHLALWGQSNVIIWPSDGAGELAEDDWLVGDGGVLLQTVVPVVHTHTHHFFRGQNGGQQLDVCSVHHTLTGRQCSEEGNRNFLHAFNKDEWWLRSIWEISKNVFETSVHTPAPCLPAPVVLSLLMAWRGQRPLGPPHSAPHLAPHPPWCHLHHQGGETAPDASLHHSSLSTVALLFSSEWSNSRRRKRSEEEVSSVEKEEEGEQTEEINV